MKIINKYLIELEFYNFRKKLHVPKLQAFDRVYRI